jgi:acetolactate synthase-1/2/3 large subunit
MKISDAIADFLEEKEIKHVFGIIGAGNVHIFDSIFKKGYTELICVHHEQAATMAMQIYYRLTGKVSAAILTTGAGSTNGVTGVVSAWADSIPGLIISGNENSKYLEPHKNLRMFGVQGYHSSAMVDKVTKYAGRVLEPTEIKRELHKAYALTTEGRPGPVWLDIPMNIQSSVIPDNELKAADKPAGRPQPSGSLKAEISQILTELRQAKRPLLWLGNGIRLANGVEYIEDLLKLSGVPALVSWAGIDMVDSSHPLVYGRAGVYGQRAANFILQNCDYLLSIGTRMAIPQVGYEIDELARAAKIAVVDVDKEELLKYASRYQHMVVADAKDFLEELTSQLKSAQTKYPEWVEICDNYKAKYPWVNPTDHPDMDGFINSYPFMEKLCHHFKDDQIVVTDMGTALLSGHQVLKMKKGQRLMTSTGLGEMGYGLPAAIGASFATDRGEVMCLNCDGGMMMNLQELQTIAHHQLPIKLFIFNNDGYLMVKHTQTAMFGGRAAGADKKSGVSCPDFSALAEAFKFKHVQIRTWEDFDKYVPEVQAYDGPIVCEVFMHPHQLFVPKLGLSIQKDGGIISPPLEDLSPFISREELSENMIIGLHPKSKSIIL